MINAKSTGMQYKRTNRSLTSTHYGTYEVETSNGQVKALHDFSQDPSPSDIGKGIIGVLDGPTRIDGPMVRAGWLDDGPGASKGRGSEPFVKVSWQQAEQLVADELNRVKEMFGNQAIYAGSYGWASAGRFHHAQSQIHRFMNCIGGCTRSVNTYSFAAAEVVVPHILGSFRDYTYPGNSWQSVIEDTSLLVAFGGLPVKNGQIVQGGVGRHVQPDGMASAAAAGVEFVNVSPLRSDVMDALNAQWLAPRPSTDTALLLSLAHTLIAEQLHDKDFVDRYCVGFKQFNNYLQGSVDGVEKSAEWAAQICALSASTIRDLARRMVKQRTMISVSWSLTRQDHGEQPYWAAINLAAMIGQMGLPGGGITFGFSAVNSVGNNFTVVRGAALPQGENPVTDFIPVARISDMLLNPGASFDYNGKEGVYPDTRIIYWAGGNPFHHHQDLNRMRKAWQRPDTIISHEWCWNSLAKHSDIVLPCATHLERQDVAFTPRDGFMVYMEQACEPYGESRTDYEILSGIARCLGVAEQYTEGRRADEWIESIYNRTRQLAAESHVELPSLTELRDMQWFEIEPPTKPLFTFESFRKSPSEFALNTPSGKIELYSDTIDQFNYADCPGHPAWFEPVEWLGNAREFPLHLISNQPANKLHSQLDHGSVSRDRKIKGREPVVMHPTNALKRSIKDGDVVRVFNQRGSCYCGVRIDENIREDVVCISTGAWFDPESTDANTACKHGNPNVLTLDKGSSSLAQGPIAHSCLVDVEFASAPPPVTAFDPPEIIAR
ncbi:MAG: molybdopterin guanine dinucleotide-containing S/N-oxide reductase [Granulosicoccus sp.]